MGSIDVLKWDAPGQLMAWKHPGSDLTTMTQLIVNESQAAVLFKNGQRCDVFGAGRHTLSTQNIPLLNRIINLPFKGRRTPFTAEVWFVNLAIPLDLKFGTPTPIQLEDPVYQIVVPVRTYGQFGLQIEDPGLFIHKLIGANLGMTQDTLRKYFKGVLISRLKSRIAQVIIHDKTGILEVETKLDELSRSLEQAYAPDYAEYGLAMRTFRIESINFPEDDPSVQALKTAKADAARRRIEGITYNQERTFDVLQTSAGNEGAGGAFASIGAGFGVGNAIGGMGQQMLGQMQQQQQTAAPPPPSTPPPTPNQEGPPPFGQAAPSFFVILNGQQQGPYTIDQLRPGVPTGEFTAQTPVWKQGMPDWLPAGQDPDLAALFDTTQQQPPPFGG